MSTNSTAPNNPEKEIFEQALDLASGAERLAFVQGACGADAALRARVLALLQAHETDAGFLPEEPAGGPPVASIIEKVGDRIGRYKLREKIGEGGCGVVYVAEQEEPVRRKVALKVIKLGMDTREVVARFEAERQALALMDHPNIAKVFDAGCTERPLTRPPGTLSPAGGEGRGEEEAPDPLSAGRPYFVMELVRGIRITDYCDQNKLSTAERLDLFIQVCHAIQHAHQKGIIHRDIKPSNVLVTLHDGVPVPKVIDFGIAKAMEQKLTEKTIYTAFEQFMGTPAYTSPEQAEMSGLDIDTRSDIYALGVLLYELLTGKTPFDGKELVAAGLEEMRRTIREKEPVRPSTRLTALVAADMRRLKSSVTGEPATTEEVRASSRRVLQEKMELINLLRGDLDWIVMKCLEKDRTRRYDTANGLAQDIDRHLRHEPVEARPPSAAYRVGKFVRRNKVLVSAAAAVAVTLVFGIVGSTWQAVRATRAEGKAEKALAEEAAQRQRTEAALDRSRELLWQANFERAQALRRSGSLGQRVQALAAIRAAAAVRPSPELRTEAIAALALADLEDVGSWHAIPSNAIREVVVDGRCARYAVATSGGQIEVRSLLNHAIEGRLTNVPRVLERMRLSQDGSRLAVQGQDRSLVWDIPTQRVLLDDPQRSCLALSPDGRQTLRLANGSGVVVWDLDEGREVARLETAKLPSLAGFAPDGQRVAVVGGQGTEVWNWRSGQKEAEFRLPNGSIGLAWRLDGAALAVGCEDRAVHIWRRSFKEIQRVACHGAGVRPFYHPGGDLLATVGWDNTLRLWDAETGSQWLETTIGYPLGFSLDGQWLAVRRSQTVGRLRVHPPEVCRRLSAGPGDNQAFGGPAFSPDSRFLASGMSGQFVVWDAPTSHLLWRQPTRGDSFVVFPHPSLLLTATSEGLQAWTNLASASAWSQSTPTTLFPLSGRIGSCRLSHDQRRLVLAVNQAGAVYDLAPITSLAFANAAAHGTEGAQSSGLLRLQPRLRLLGQPMFQEADFSLDGQWIASGYWNNQGTAGSALWIWSAAEGRPVHQIALGNCAPHFSPDGRWFLAAASREYRLYAVEGRPDQWRELWRTPRDSPGFELSAAAFKHDGTCVALLADQQIIRLVTPATGREVARLPPPARQVIAMDWSPDGRWLAAGCQAGSHLWDLTLLRARLGELGLDWE